MIRVIKKALYKEGCTEIQKVLEKLDNIINIHKNVKKYIYEQTSAQFLYFYRLIYRFTRNLSFVKIAKINVKKYVNSRKKR